MSQLTSAQEKNNKQTPMNQFIASWSAALTSSQLSSNAQPLATPENYPPISIPSSSLNTMATFTALF